MNIFLHKFGAIHVYDTKINNKISNDSENNKIANSNLLKTNVKCVISYFRSLDESVCKGITKSNYSVSSK